MSMDREQETCVLDRRWLLSRGAAAGAAASAVAIAGLPARAGASTGSDPEAALLQAIREVHSADGALEAADIEQGAAYARCNALGPVPLPEEVFQREGDRDLNLPEPHLSHEGKRLYSPLQADQFRQRPRKRDVYYPCPPEMGVPDWNRIVRAEPWPEAQARANEIVAGWDRCQAERASRKKISGVTAAEAACAAARARLQASYLALASMHVQTLRGCILKAAMVAQLYGGPEDFNEEILAGDHTHDVQIALSLARDLSRLATPAELAAIADRRSS